MIKGVEEVEVVAGAGKEDGGLNGVEEMGILGEGAHSVCVPCVDWPSSSSYLKLSSSGTSTE